jgi:hypothetical protein
LFIDVVCCASGSTRVTRSMIRRIDQIAEAPRLTPSTISVSLRMPFRWLASTRPGSRSDGPSRAAYGIGMAATVLMLPIASPLLGAPQRSRAT